MTLTGDGCLTCELPDCRETDPGCVYWNGREDPQKKYYRKMSQDPEWVKKNYDRNKQYRKTPVGRKSASECAVRWQKKNPDKQKKIQDRYVDNNRAKINADRKAWRATPEGKVSTRASQKRYREKVASLAN